MRYVCMHKVSPRDEAGEPPPPELIAGMGQLIGEMAQAGVFLAGEGLKPSSQRHRLTWANGRWTTKEGPLQGANELPAGFAVIKVASTDEALRWAQRYGAAVGATEVELGPLVEPWDLGMGPKPSSPTPLRFLIVHQATADTEAGVALSPQQRADVDRLTAEMVAADVLVFAESLQPSSQSVRARYRDNDRTVIDGPFTESKELIGGFCMMQMRSVDEVLAFADRFARVVGGTCELDVRPVAEAGPPRTVAGSASRRP